MNIFMDVDTALAGVPVNIHALIDDTDFKTRETGIVYNQAGMDLVWNFVTTAGAYTQTAVTPTTAGVYDWTHKGDAMYSIEIPASGGGSINNDTEGFGWFSGYCTGVLPWRGPVICFRAAGTNDLLIDSAYSATRGLSGTALPDAACDAAGGIPKSDAGGLDIDAKLANTNEITVARMGALTDWLNGERLDVILDAIPTTPMRGTDNAALAATALSTATWTAARAAVLSDWINDGRLDLILDIIAADVVNIDGEAMRGTDSGALAATALSTAVWTAARAGALTDWLNGERLDVILDAIPTTAMRGTDGANTVVPDVAGTAATPAEVAQALIDIHLDHLLAANYDPASKPGVGTALLNELIEDDSGVSRYTANALEQAPSGGGATNPNVLLEAEIAAVTDQTHFTLATGSDVDDAYKDQAIVLYDDTNSDYPSVRVCTAYTGATKTVTIDAVPDFTLGADDSVKIFVTAPGTSAPTVGQIRTEMDTNSTKLIAIVADTDELQTDWTNDGRLDVILDAIPTTAMRGTDSAYTGTPPTVTQIRQEMDANSTRLDADVSSRSSHAATDIWTVGARTLTSFGTLVADIWNRLTSALTTSGSVGKLLVDNVDTTISSRSTLSAANVKSEADDALTDIHLDHLLAVDYDPASKPGVATALLNELVENDTGVSRFTENALEQAPSGTGGDATAANQTTIITHLTEVKGAGFAESTDSNEAIRNRGDAAWTTGSGLSGSNAITINIKDQSSNNVVECAVEIWDSANTTFYERKTTDASGNTTHNMDDGTYTVRIHKAGYTFSDQTLVVTIAETKNYTGTTVIIGTPSDVDACRVYDFAFQSDGLTPVATIDASCFISSLPYDYSGKIHSGERQDAIFDSETGKLYWDLVRGSTVKFSVKHFGYTNKSKVIPDSDQARLTDIEN